MEGNFIGQGHPSGLPRSMLVGFLDAVPASAAILDPYANIIAVNAAWRRFATCNDGDPEAWAGQNYLNVVEQAAEDDDAGRIAVGLREVLGGQTEWFGHEYPCHSTTTQRWFRCLIAPLHDGDGHTIIGSAVMHLDVTAQKTAELGALAASRAKSEFLASLSHELRTPLNAVIGFSEMMMIETWGALGNDHYRDYANDIHSAGSHLLSLINEVLDLSKVEAGRFELQDAVVDVPSVIQQSLALVNQRAGRAGLAATAQSASSLPRLRADARLLHQILLNLLSNAVKFTPAGGTVTIRTAMAADGWLEISVKDTGIGIRPEDFERVLEPFGQVDSDMARAHSNESTGLGLPLARRFAELHGGCLLLASTPGQGTTVTIRFPPDRVMMG